MVEFVKRDALWVPEKKGVGRAYAVFDCPDSPDAVRKEIGHIVFNLLEKDKSKLELSLSTMTDFNRLNKDQDLARVINEAQVHSISYGNTKQKVSKEMRDLGYVLSAEYNPGTNNDAGDALNVVMAGIQSRYFQNKPFLSQIAGRDPQGYYKPWTSD